LALGIEKTKILINDYKEEAKSIIDTLPANRDFFYNFIDFLVNRVR